MDRNLAEKIWNVIFPILQIVQSNLGRPPHSAKKAFFGILYVLENGCKWRCLPRYFGPKSTVHGKYMKWLRAGLIDQALIAARKIYLGVTNAFPNWGASDTSTSKAPHAKFSGKNPTDRGKRGVKKNIICDSKGAPLFVAISPANQHDSKTLLPLLKQARSIQRGVLIILALDSAYDSKDLRKKASRLGFVLHAATNKRRNKDCPIVKPKGRWVVEASHSWLNNFRAVKICYAKNIESYLGFVQLAATARLLQMAGISG